MDEKIIWSIGFVLIVIILCLLKPNAGRIFLGIFYLIMDIGVNCVNAFTNPQSTVQMGADSLIPLYRTFFSEVVSAAPSLFILIVALFQIIVGLLILNKHKKVKLGLTGASVFLVFITPFGIIQLPWLGMAAVQIFLLRKDFNKTFVEIIAGKFRENK
jgi:hypothetical protein